MTIAGLSLEAPVSEEQFLLRELGIAWEQVDASALITALDKPQLVIVSEPGAYVELLRHVPPRKAVLVMISDEAYSTQRLEFVQRSPAIRSVYRQYDTALAPPLPIAKRAMQLAGQAKRAGIRATSLVDLIRIGRATRERMRSWGSVGVPVRPVPLGYTNAFAEAYASVREVAPRTSFFDLPALPRRERETPITFRGSLGQTERQIMIATARSNAKARIEVLGTDWSGGSDEHGESYVQSLLNAQRALCPPGFVNTETFRYYEAMLCGAQPIEPITALTHQGIPMGRGVGGITLTQLALSSLRARLQKDLED